MQVNVTLPPNCEQISAYEATTPPDAATCGVRGCRTVAAVRMVIPQSRFEADGVEHSKDPSTFDTCEWHWPRMRDACVRNGHRIVDTTGDLAQLAADYPHCTIFASDGGRLFASARVNGSMQGVTVDAWLVGQLRVQLEQHMSACYG